MKLKRVGILTAGGLAPCLSAAIGALIEAYNKASPKTEIICYRGGYRGLLLGDKVTVTGETRQNVTIFFDYGGSPIGNSRVKLTNARDCIRRGYVAEDANPQEVAAEQLMRDGIQVLHTIGGDDTNTAAADLAKFLQQNDYKLGVIGLPKTVDNDVYPIAQSLGATTAAHAGATFFENIVAESTANPRTLIVHEIMGRNCGWLTVATALEYRRRLKEKKFLPELGLGRGHFDIHGIYIPEMAFDIATEAQRLQGVMETFDGVNLFISEGAGIENIVKEMEIQGKEVTRDAFGHIKLDAINSGQWFANAFAEKIGAEKNLVQKSGYFARSAKANEIDLKMIRESAALAVKCAIEGKSGVIGYDEDNKNELACINFSRIKGGKPFDVRAPEFLAMLSDLGQITQTNSPTQP
ncbi:MAG: pyrophosphate--fructose-6-phosphate 1-phosphotransferase [Puniceicoccales bacterium]|jgi:pyrophosphate--fructose-6-phosphate 1-phosphotransferase|nr:pyrophosphate--fructose-6-phosphate 1-phosphotransferase [Puniceicoccales bacterium]